MTAKVLQPGDMIGGNEVVRLLGAGGFAQVYEVRDRTGARRALKVLDADAEARPKLRARLAQEGAAIALIEHVNVVRLHDAGADGDRFYLLLELVQGRTLREVLDAHGRRSPPEAAARWIRQAAEGVAEAHRTGIIHRDLKPENLLVTPEDVVKVIDFGIAKLTGWGVKTSHQQRVGTALYMSPEQIQGQEADPRMDVYALGLILYEALSGAHPLVTEPATVFHICALHLQQRPRPLAEVAPGVPADLCAIADRAIEKDPSRRFPGMRAFADALHGALLHFGEDRRASLHSMMRAPAPRGGPLATTQRLPELSQPMLSPSRATHDFRSSSLPSVPVPSRPPTHPGGTLPISTSLPISTTASVIGPAPAAPIAPPAARAPRLPLRAQHAPVQFSVVLVVLAAVLLGTSGGVWIVMRLWPRPAAPAASDGAKAR